MNKLTDDDIIIHLHNLARKLEDLGKYGETLRQVADRFAELSKQDKVKKYQE